MKGFSLIGKFLLASCLSGLATFAHTGGIRMSDAPLVALSQGQALYANLGGTTQGDFGRTQVAPEILALADSLALMAEDSSGTFQTHVYVAHAYSYVKSEIVPEFRFGLTKGGLGALLDKSGTPFDQAQLLKDLLSAKYITTTYVYGTATLTGAQFEAWTGISTAKEACKLLANGGIPAQINGASPESCALVGSVSSAAFSHVWLQVTSGKANYLLDPSFKEMTSYLPQTDFLAAMGYSRSDFLKAITIPPTKACYECPLTEARPGSAKLATQLGQFANSYYQFVKTNHHDTRSLELTGGNEITHKVIAPTASELNTLPYQGQQQQTSTSIPDKLRTKLVFSYLVSYDNLTPAESLSFFADETYGGLISFSTTAHPSAMTTAADTVRCSLQFDRVEKHVRQFAEVPVQLAIDHPYIGASANLRDSSSQFTLNCRMPSVLIHGYGNAGEALIKLNDRFTEGRVNINKGSPYGDHLGAWQDLTLGWKQVIPAAAKYLYEQGQRSEFLAGITRSHIVNHHTMGLVSQPIVYNYSGGSGSVVQQALTLSLDTAMSYSPKVSTASDRTIVGRSLSWLLASLEGEVAQQLSGGAFAFSTANRFGWGADQEPVKFNTYAPAQSVPRPAATFFHSPSSNITLGLASQASYMIDKLTARANEYTRTGYKVVLPNVAIMGPGELVWRRTDSQCSSHSSMPSGGAPQYCIPTTLYDAQLGLGYGSAFYAENEQLGDFVHVMLDNRGMNRGGGSGTRAPMLEGGNLEPPKADSRQKLEHGVQKNNGDVSYAFNNLISVGGEFPYGLAANVSIKTATAEPEFIATTSPMSKEGRWGRVQRQYEINNAGSITFSSDGVNQLGKRSPLEASVAVATIAVLLDISGSSEVKAPIINAMITRWFASQLLENTLTVSSPMGSDEFVRHADGNFYPAPQSPTSVAVTLETKIISVKSSCAPDSGVGQQPPNEYGLEWLDADRVKTVRGTAIRTLKNGDKETFAPRDYFTSRWNCPPRNPWHPLVKYENNKGVTVDYEYDQFKQITKISNNLGRALNFASSGDPVLGYKMVISDSAGREAVVQEDLANQRIDITNSTGKKWIAEVSTAQEAGKVPFAGHVLKAIYAPEDTVKPMIRYDYDALWQAKAIALRKDTEAYWEKAYRWGHMPGYGNIEVDSAHSKVIDYFDNRGNISYQLDALGVATASQFNHLNQVVDQRTFTQGSRFNKIPNNGSLWGSRLSGYENYERKQTFTYDNNANVIQEILSPATGKPNADKNLATDRTWHPKYGAVLSETFRYESGTSPVVAVTHVYDDLTGNLTKSSTSTGLVAEYKDYWNGLPRLITEGSASTVIRKKEIVYDSYGNATSFKVQKPDGSTPITVLASYSDPTFGNLGDVVTLTDPNGNVTSATYHADRQIKTLKNAGNITSSYSYTPSGQLEKIVTSSSAGSSKQVTAGYNPLGWMTSLADNTGDTKRFDYDARGLTEYVTDEMGRKTRYDYNRNGKLTCQRDGWGTPLQRTYKHLQYDALGQLIAYNSADSDPNSDCSLDSTAKQTTVEYDAYGQLWKTSFPNEAPHGATNEQLSYWPGGGVKSKINRRGETITYTYASNNANPELPTSKTVASGSAAGYVISYSQYDVFGKPERIVQTGANPNTLTFNYDFADRGLNWATQKIGSELERKVSYAYDKAGNRTKLTWPDGYSIDFVPDALNRIDLVKSGAMTLANYDYDDLGRPNKITYANGVVTNLSYESDDDLDLIAHNFVGGANNLRFDYDYNAAAQLVKSTLSNRSYHWRAPATQAQDYVPNKLNQYVTVGGVTLGYDQAGNLTTGKTGSFDYDAENKLTRAVMTVANPAGALTASYAYDANGRRTEKSVVKSGATTVTQYLSDADHEIAEYNGNSSTPSKRFIYGKSVDEILAMHDVAANSYTYAHRNRQGSVIAASNAAGQVTAQNIYTYSAYGEPNTLAGFPYRYTGRRLDPETGLYYYRARYYNAEMGRFLQTDPVGYKDQMNLYAYVHNDPVNMTDPTGKWAFIPWLLGLATTGGTTAVATTTTTAAVSFTATEVAVGVVVGSGLAATAIAVNNESAEGSEGSGKSRNKPPEPLAEAEGNPHSIIEKPGKDGQYTTHNGDGTKKQYRGAGKDHGSVPRPNVKEYGTNTTPDGETFPDKGRVRPPEPEEIPN